MSRRKKEGSRDPRSESEKRRAEMLESSGNQKDRRPLIFGLVAIILAGLLLVGALFYVLASGDDEQTEQAQQEETQQDADEDAGADDEGESAGDDAQGSEKSREGAVQAAADILNAAYVEYDTEEEYMEFLEGLGGGDYSELDDELVDSVRTVDVLDSEQGELTSYQNVIILAAMVKQVQGLDEDEPIEPLHSAEEIEQNVLYDEQLGTAYVPVSTFAGSQALFTMEMVYVDGEWNLAPYSLMEGIQIMSSASSSEGGPGVSFDELGDIQPGQ